MNIPKEEHDNLINQAGEFLDIHKGLRSWVCIEDALNRAIWLQKELDELREAHYGLPKYKKN